MIADLLEAYRKAREAERIARDELALINAKLMMECPLRPGDMFTDLNERGWVLVEVLRWEESESRSGVIYWWARVAPMTSDLVASKIRHQKIYIHPEYRKYGWTSVEGL